MGIRTALALLILLSVPNAFGRDLSAGMLAAPHDLGEVNAFKWYIVTFPAEPDAEICVPELGPAMRAFLSAGKIQTDVKISFNEGGGASDVFLFRLYLEQKLFRATNSPTAVCLTNYRAELGYYDRMKMLKGTGPSPLSPKLVLWEYPPEPRITTMSSSTGDALAAAKSQIANDAAEYASRAVSKALEDIRDVKTRGWE